MNTQSTVAQVEMSGEIEKLQALLKAPSIDEPAALAKLRSPSGN